MDFEPFKIAGNVFNNCVQLVILAKVAILIFFAQNVMFSEGIQKLNVNFVHSAEVVVQSVLVYPFACLLCCDASP